MKVGGSGYDGLTGDEAESNLVSALKECTKLNLHSRFRRREQL